MSLDRNQHKEIHIRGGFVALVDEEDYERIAAIKWCIAKGGNSSTLYARCTMVVNGKRTTVLMHKVVSGMTYVDHINGNTFDNRKDNLRQANHSTNAFNRVLTDKSRTGFKGVRRTKYGMLQVGITAFKRYHYVGTYTDPHIAAHEYNKAAVKLHGEFCRLNPVGTDPRSE